MTIQWTRKRALIVYLPEKIFADFTFSGTFRKTCTSLFSLVAVRNYPLSIPTVTRLFYQQFVWMGGLDLGMDPSCGQILNKIFLETKKRGHVAQVYLKKKKTKVILMRGRGISISWPCKLRCDRIDKICLSYIGDTKSQQSYDSQQAF